MAQTTQIVPKYSFPYVETHINDYTQVADTNVTEAADTSVIMAYAVAAGKGVDNVWVRKKSKSSAVKTFGDSNFKKFGQPLMQALNVLDRDNSQVWMMRVMPENATYANSIVSAYYKADTAEEVADPHKRKFRIKLTAKSVKDITTKDALIEASKVLETIPADLTEDEKVGFKIVRRALEEPIRQIADNAGLDGAVIADRAKVEKKGVGYNAYTGEWVNMMEAGIIDPAKVTTSALKNAASIAGTLLTTECAITDIPEPKAPAAPAPDMGGMY